MKTEDGFHDLGETYEPMETKDVAENMPHYPCLYFSGKQADGLKGLPDEGEAVIKFKKAGESTRKDKDGKESYSVELEIHAIKAGKAGKVSEEEEEAGEPPAKGRQSDEEAIEKGLEAAAKSKE